MFTSHYKEIQKLTFRALPLRWSESCNLIGPIQPAIILLIYFSGKSQPFFAFCAFNDVDWSMQLF